LAGIQTSLGQLSRDVALQVSLPQALAGSVGQGGYAIRGEPKGGGNLSGFKALDLEVPQDGAPALRQRLVGVLDELALNELKVGVGVVNGLVKDRVVIGWLNLALGLASTGSQVAHTGEQIGPEELVRAFALLKEAENLGEGLRHQVVYVGMTRRILRGHQPRGTTMALVKKREGALITLPG